MGIDDTATDLPAVRELLHARIDRSADPESGASRLRVVIPGGKSPEIYCFTVFLRHPDLAELIAEGFRGWAIGVAATSRSDTHGNLLRGLGAFLATCTAAVTPEAIDEAFWTGFLRFLDAPKSSGQPWAPSTRSYALGAVKACLHALEDHPDRAEPAKRLIYHSGMPKNPWSGRSRKTVPTEIILPQEVNRIITACLAAVRGIEARLDRNADLLAIGRSELEEARLAGIAPDHSRIPVCAARIEEAFPDRLATLDDLHRLDPDLGRKVEFLHGMTAIRETLYNSADDLVPFILLLAFKTVFNPDTLLSLDWDSITPSHEEDVVIFHGQKPRSSRTQTSTHDETEDVVSCRLPDEAGVPLGLGNLLDILDRLTARTRAIVADPGHSRRLFVAAPIQGGSAAKAFQHPMGPSVDTMWKGALGRFIAAHGLTPFSLKMIRATGGDETRRRYGLFAQAEQMGHQSPQTTRTFYTSDWVRKEGQDRIGETQVLYHRMAETRGVIDPRGLGANGRQAAATPGFLCLDPFHSPRPGQRSGALCTAYGECPSCPLMAADLASDEPVARHLSLRAAIIAASMGRVSAEQWRQKWQPVLADLDALLAHVPQPVMDAARRLRITLPIVS
ncbi:hypothetical protein [Poseidonocella sp. HB161398]|uniref:hypothetical protein n=1 Tax=Poseidonocella sp. HB161398 TaxID=2320855 RepID=UPI001107BEA7|nr:hypothetical protein [Poseidonocella sp. HB161398]